MPPWFSQQGVVGGEETVLAYSAQKQWLLAQQCWFLLAHAHTAHAPTLLGRLAS